MQWHNLTALYHPQVWRWTQMSAWWLLDWHPVFPCELWFAPPPDPSSISSPANEFMKEQFLLKYPHLIQRRNNASLQRLNRDRWCVLSAALLSFSCSFHLGFLSCCFRQWSRPMKACEGKMKSKQQRSSELGLIASSSYLLTSHF